MNDSLDKSSMKGIRGASTRYFSLDAFRGLIVILMALDHANHFIAHKHSSGEYWGGPFPTYRETLPFLTRLVTHPVAPGFSFLMGIGIVLFARARRKKGWTPKRIFFHLSLRGLVLIFIQLVVVNRAWELSPQGWGLANYFGVLIALGGGMILGGLLVWLKPWQLAGLAVIMFVGMEILTPAPDQWSQVFSRLLRVVYIPGGDAEWWVNYPILQWFELVLFGMAFGKSLAAGSGKTLNRVWILGIGFLGGGVILRAINGFGNIRPSLGESWIDFFNLVKYPPSMTFILFTMGFNLIVLSLFANLDDRWQRVFKPLAVFGRVPLFFYIAHLFLFAAMGNLFARQGMSIPAMLPFWLVGILVLYPACLGYAKFKARQPADSFIRFF